MTNRDFDGQLLESVAVRRRRLRGALLWGTARGRRVATENVGRFIAGVTVAAVLAGGCVGWSFLRQQLERQKEQQNQNRRGTVPAPSVSMTGSPGSAISGLATYRPTASVLRPTSPIGRSGRVD